MAYDFLDIFATRSVKAAQGPAAQFSADRPSDRFTEAETGFIAERDSAYMASVAENGWPYVQHRGGPPGFLRVLDETTLGFADFRGNRQHISLGNLMADGRVALILMDYPHRRRLKILGHARIVDAGADPALAERLTVAGYRARVERAILIRLQAFDWNCPQHITPRLTEAELHVALAPVQRHIAELEAELAQLRARLELAGGA